MTKSFLNNKEVVIASHNSGKILEFKSLLSKYNVKIITSSEIKVPDVDEVGKTFRENSILKAKSIPDTHICISDDSGLCIDSLEDFQEFIQQDLQKKRRMERSHAKAV